MQTSSANSEHEQNRTFLDVERIMSQNSKDSVIVKLLISRVTCTNQ